MAIQKSNERVGWVAIGVVTLAAHQTAVHGPLASIVSKSPTFLLMPTLR
jgi:hypothetical protein